MLYIEQHSLTNLRRNLHNRLRSGCDNAVSILRDNTPVDTKRLWESTRCELVNESKDVLEYRIVAGGLSLKGIIREQDVSKDVNYAIYVESRTNYARNSLVNVKDAIVREFST